MTTQEIIELLDKNRFFSHLTGEEVFLTIYSEKEKSFRVSDRDDVELLIKLHGKHQQINAVDLTTINELTQIAHNYL